MHWIDKECPHTAYIVEVKVKDNGEGDVTITTCRCKDMPKPRSNSRGFTEGFWIYESAVRYARHVIAELGIKALV